MKHPADIASEVIECLAISHKAEVSMRIVEEVFKILSIDLDPVQDLSPAAVEILVSLGIIPVEEEDEDEY